MQGEKIEAWSVSQASREYFGVEYTGKAYLLPTNSQKKTTHWQNELSAS